MRTAADGDDRYALPEIARYRPAARRLRFSYASVDAAADGLLVGEYVDAAPGARLARWPFAARRAAHAGDRASDAWVTAHSNLQGAAVALPGRLLLAESRGARLPGRLHASPYADGGAAALGGRRRGPRAVPATRSCR